MLKVNKKLLTKSISLALAPTLLFSMSSCSNGTLLLTKKQMLANKYYNGYYLDNSCLEDMLVVKTKDGKYRIVDEDLKSIYSNEKHAGKEITELYQYLDSDTLMLKKVTNTDLINLEKLINGDDTISFESAPKTSSEDLLIANNRDFRNHINDFHYRYVDAGLSEIEILFLDGKASRIVRRTEEDDGATTLGDEAIDIISGNVVHPCYDGIAKVSTFCNEDMKAQKITSYEFVPIADLFNEIVKDEYTGEEVVELFYLIQGKTKEEVTAVLTEYNNALKGTAKTLK